MKERPVLMNAAMVRAILDGRKTQTRRPVKLNIGNDNRFHVPGKSYVMNICDPRAVEFCPFGQSGDRLWVRETWAHDAPSLEECRARLEDGLAGGLPYGPYYRTDSVHEGTGLRWRPSIHMPRWASRITLEITDVRVERVQDITEAAAKAEGVPPAWLDVNGKDVNAHAAPTFRQGFARTMREIYGWGLWEMNMWVWAIEFRRRVQP
ncbi:MAG: hypothetical protein Q7J24_16935 [Desulfomicrobium sp.]|nr:hypothetical protein [Desulfomicrobium sp.]